MSGFVRWTDFLKVGVLALPLAVACGDDGGGSGDPDAGGEDPDAMSSPDAMQDPVLMRSGNFAIFENTVVTPTGDPAAVGAQVSLSLVDTTTTRVAPEYFDEEGEPTDSNINGCAVTVFDDLDSQLPQADPVDEGAFTVTGTDSDEFECTFGTDPLNPTGPMRYTCQSTDGAAAGAAAVGSTAQRTEGNLAKYAFMGADFSNANYVGMLLLVDGFENQAANGAFPIVRQGGGTLGNNELVVVNENDFQENIIAVADNPGTYTTLVGEAPLPLPATDPAGGFNTFLDNGEADVVITGGASSDILDEINTTLNANGDGFTLDGEGTDVPWDIPVDGSAVTFSCTAGGCGETGGGIVEALVVTMETTDATPEGPFDMPAPESSFATVQCAFIGFPDGKEVTIPTEVMQKVMGTSPERIQVTVANAAGSIEKNADETSSVNLLVGHALTGFSPPPAPAQN